MVFEELTGQDKFGMDNPASVTHILSANKDGTSAHISKLDESYVNKIINDVQVNIRFGIDDDIRQSAPSGSFWAAMKMSGDMREDICKHFSDILLESESDVQSYLNKSINQLKLIKIKSTQLELIKIN